ncbi:TPA: hypothetical protein ACH3X3_010981 [Trebouxia sp. C0006]
MVTRLSATQPECAQAADPFKGFEIERVLSDSDRTKSMAVLGRWSAKPEKAVLLLSRKPFHQSGVQAMLDSSPKSELQFRNDIYAKYTSTLAPDQGAITVDTIYPASEKHIRKHTTQKFLMVTETPALYCEKVLPLIQAIPQSQIKWVHNILDKKAETDRLLFEDPDPEQGFMMHPDLKWDQKQKEGLYCIVLCNRRDLKSLRDLTADHVTMLKNIKQKACKVSSCQLCFCSFRLHVQFCNWSVEHTGQFATQLHYPNTIVALLDQLCNACLYCISCT